MELARKNFKLNAELDLSNEHSRQLSEFHLAEGRNLENESASWNFSTPYK
jgi:hypothetical protein